jgi:hypothetical protein
MDALFPGADPSWPISAACDPSSTVPYPMIATRDAAAIANDRVMVWFSHHLHFNAGILIAQNNDIVSI